MVSRGRKINCVLSASCPILFLYILFLCSCGVDYCCATDTLKQGNWITYSSGTTLVSNGGKFEMGFFTSSNHKRFAGIWYKWDPPTRVWVANRDNPVINGSTDVSFGIAEDGNLQVWDTAGNVYWNTSLENSSSTNRSVKLMDSGNLVLTDDQLATSRWESFQNPTDTFLPGMKMDENLTLTSWIGDDDPRVGNFTFRKDLQGEDYYVIISKMQGLDYWRSWMSGNFLSLDEMFSGTIVNLLSNFNTSTSRPVIHGKDYNYTRLVMKQDGELQYLKWTVGNGSWSLIWRKPEDHQCGIYNACGKFGVCNINNRLVCKCLPGFHPTYQNHWDSADFLGGCTRNSTSSDNSDIFLSLKMMKVGDPDFIFMGNNETECKKECLDNSQCQAYLYDKLSSDNYTTETVTGICYIWVGDLSNLQEEYTNGGSDLFVRVAKSAIESTVRNCEPCGTNLIPYPLSTGPNCGERIYFSFNCNNSTGQVSFKTPSGTYRVTSIDPSTRTFVIQEEKHTENRDARNSLRNLQLNGPFSGPFNSSEAEVHIIWDTPQPPTCTLLEDCKDWPNSICKKAEDEKMRCLCTGNLQWNGSILNCTKELVGGDFPQPSEQPSKGKTTSLTLTVMIPLIVVFLLASSIVCIYLWRRNMAKKQENTRSDGRNRVLRTLDSERHLQDLMGSGEFREEDEKGIDVPYFDLESIIVATDNFSDVNKLGQGGYGPVYKGTFPDGQKIAVKRLSNVSGQGLQEFKNEVVLIAKLQHRNLVRLRGYCIKGDEKILLYEYMPNKSLDSFIFDQKLSMRLDWEMRVNIVLGIARGLLYLHHDSRLRIIHRDLKTSNILLDEEMNPKISDFGLARIVGGKETGANTTRVVGTYGYMSPEYALDGLFSVKSDVFSFGVVLLEIITGKKNTGFYQSKQAMSLIGYAWRLWVEEKVLDLMDPALQNVCNADQFVKCVNVGLLCVQEDPNDRPTMSNVVTMLDSEAVTVPTPKQPAFIPWRGLPSKASSSSKPDSTYTELTSSLEEKHDTA